jgi:DNA-binding XRE family transcriptional regulator
MDKEQFIGICDSRLKLVRTEYGLSQEHMALVVGISKKTLVDIEKERRSLGWIGSVALCSLFQDSEILAGTFGGNPTDMLMALAFDSSRRPAYPSTRGGRIWWTLIWENERYVIQQNIVSQHYRLITRDNKRVASSFQIEDLIPIFESTERE